MFQFTMYGDMMNLDGWKVWLCCWWEMLVHV